MKFFRLMNGVMLSDEGAYPYPVEWVTRADFERELIKHAAHFNEEMEKADTRESLARQECDAIADLNHTQFLELEYLRPIVKAAETLLYESEEYDFDDGLGKGAAQSHWDDLASTLEPATDAIEQVLNASPLWAHRRNGGDSGSDAKPPQKNYVGSTGQYYVKQPDGHNMLCNADGTRSIFDDVDE